MSEEIPDLKRLLVGLAQEMNRLHPEVVTDVHVERIRSADNVLLVTSRVLMGLSKKVGVDDVAIKRIVNQARHILDAPLFGHADQNVGKTDGHITDWQIMQKVDDCRSDLKTRVKVPTWFIEEMWPAVLRRCAGGDKMSDRERAIAQYVVSTARGER